MNKSLVEVIEELILGNFIPVNTSVVVMRNDLMIGLTQLQLPIEDADKHWKLRHEYDIHYNNSTDELMRRNLLDTANILAPDICNQYLKTIGYDNISKLIPEQYLALSQVILGLLRVLYTATTDELTGKMQFVSFDDGEKGIILLCEEKHIYYRVIIQGV